MQKKFLPLLLVAVVLVAGCTTENQKPVSAAGCPDCKGLGINDFSSDKDTVFEKQSVRLSFEVKNNGESTIKKDRAKIFLNTPAGWSISSVSGAVSAATATTTSPNSVVRFTKDLNPEDKVREIPSGTATVRWTVSAPDVPKGQTTSDKIITRAYYDYNTTAEGNFWVYSEAEANQIRDKGETLQKSSFRSSKGPITVDLSVAPDPVEVSGDTETYTLSITLKNNDPGYVISPGALGTDTSSNLPDLSLVANKPAINIYIDGQTQTCTDAANVEIIKSEAKVLCDFTVSKPGAKTSHTVRATASYGYYIDSEVTVKVAGKD